MNKIEYYVECTCNKDVSFPNVDFHPGDVLYYNKNAYAEEMYLGYDYRTHKSVPHEVFERYNTLGKWARLPFTRQKRFAKKWTKDGYADRIAMQINHIGDFTAVVKKINVTYTEEEI